METDYIKIVEELRAVILQCYADIILLETFDKLSDIEKGSSFIEFHLSYIVKMDLALNVYKICIDKNKSANTIPKLVNCVNRDFKDDKMFEPIKKNKMDKLLENELKEMRSTFIAHLDINHNNKSIQINSIKTVVMNAKEDYNKVCDCDKLPLLKEYRINDKELYMINYEVSLGFGIMLAKIK